MDRNQFEKVPTREIESGVVDIAITKQLIKEIGNLRWTPLSRHEFAIFKIQLGLLF